MLQPALNLLNDVRPGFFVDKSFGDGFHRFGSDHQLTHSMRAPHQAALLGIINLGVGAVVKPVRAQMKFWL